MRRIGLAVVLAVSLTLAPLAGEGQQSGKVPRIGFLSSGSRSAVSHILDAFRQGRHRGLRAPAPGRDRVNSRPPGGRDREGQDPSFKSHIPGESDQGL